MARTFRIFRLHNTLRLLVIFPLYMEQVILQSNCHVTVKPHFYYKGFWCCSKIRYIKELYIIYNTLVETYEANIEKQMLLVLENN